ncbi:MAG: hypothetical protein PHI88_01580 [Candidatus Pacebacteria bacterium]|nr:hypothetical protein [Candidatus Paceibacterota bacterium]
MEKISKKTLERIKKEKITPVPRWRFLLKNYVTWLFFGLSIIIGSISFAVLLFMILSNDWDIYKYFQKSFFEYLIGSLPYLWIIFLAVFLFLADYNLKNTKGGYRHKTYLVLILSIIISIILGSFLYSFGFGERINDVFADNFPYYRKTFYQRQEIWTNPEKGLLGGVIVKVKNESEFSLKDFKNKIWQIKARDTNFKGNVTIQEGGKVKIIGKTKDLNIFIAEEIRPWISGKGGQRNGRFRNKLQQNIKNFKGGIRNP